MLSTMSPHRSHHRGSFVLDRQFARIGRIRVASGTSDPVTFRRMNEMITTLKETARWDLLRALRGGVFSALELWAAFRNGQLDTLPTADEMLPAQETIDRWLPRLEVSEGHRDQYERILKKLLEPDAKTRVNDLPQILKAFRDQCQDKGRRRTFNMTRSAVQAFVRDVLGSGHRLWSATADVPRLKETPRKGNPQTLDQLVELAKKLRPHHGILWSLALTGMRRGEYWAADHVARGSWEPKGDRVLVHGTKTAGSDRFIPLVLPPASPTIGYWGFIALLRDATKGAVTVHDLRKTYARLMEEAGVVRARRRIYLGHGKADITDLYEIHEVSAFIAQDAERLRAFIGDAPAKALQVLA